MHAVHVLAARLGWRLSLLLCAVVTIACGLWVEPAAAQVEKGVTLVKADLLADTTAIVPGKAFTVGLRLKMAPHWHTYWLNSGDAGLPTKIDWQLPDGFKAGPIQWPLPDKIETPGDIINYGYSDEVVLLTEVTPPANLPAGGEVTLKAKATWLVCADKCIPGQADLSLGLPAGGDAQAANAELFAKYRALLPVPADPAKAGVGLQGKFLTFQLNGTGGAPSGVEFYPLPGPDAEVGHPQEAKVMTVAEPPSWGAFCVVELTSDPKDADQVGGVWVLTDKDGKKSAVSVAPTKPVVAAATPGAGAQPSATPAVAVASPPSGTSSPSTGSVTGPATPAGSLWHFLLLGFVGGLILNVMPCVLPVISLKLFSFVKQANEDRARVFRLGLAYAAGVFAWFLGFAGLVVGLRAAGHQVGYAFHLQSPWFLVGLSAATFVFALNLLGVFEIVLPGTVTNAAANAEVRRDGYAGAFIQGMLATVLGSACTAPVFGEALAFAFSQSAVGIFAMFAAIAAGMSAPFVLLAAFPGWLRFLPKPGAWMERVKQATGFLLLATVLWLLFVLGRSKGSDGVVWTGVLLLTLGVACWVQGAFNTFTASNGTRWAAWGATILILLSGGQFAVRQIAASRPPETVAGAKGFAAQLDAALKTGRPVFVDFTADWCVSCKSNERLVLSSDAVQKALADGNVMFLKADYTTYSEDVAKLLKQFNAASVPLYVVYPAGKPDAPNVLPTLLTKQTVLDALAAAQPPVENSKPLAAR